MISRARAILACAALSIGPEIARTHGDGPSDAGELQRRVAALSQRIGELAPGEDVLDSLHFGWFDRPYARATLATLVKTSAVLQREVRLRNAGNGAIPAAALDAMLHWADDAVDRVLADEPDPRFRPHRMRIAAGNIVNGTTPPLFAILDRATATRSHSAFGDLDLLAALGQRTCARSAFDLRDEANSHTLVRRAEFLGMALVVVLPNPPDEEKEPPAPVSLSDDVLRVEPLTLTEWMVRAASDSTRGLTAVMDPTAGEPWPSRIARRALARGLKDRSRCVVCGWNPGPIERKPTENGSPTAAAMWLDAFDGLSLAVASGWRDLRDGSADATPSIFTRPDEIEVLARTSLDILRFADAIRPLEGSRSIAIVVSSDAIDPLDNNKWADWIEPFFAALAERQIPFDIVSDSGGWQGRASRYSVVFPIRRSDAAELNIAIVRLERELATVEGWASRRTVREFDGSLPRDLFVRAAESKDGRSAIAIVNLSGSSRELTLTGGYSSGRLRDILSDSPAVGRDGRFKIGPWHGRLWVAP